MGGQITMWPVTGVDTYSELTDSVHDAVLKLRNIDRVIHTSAFKQVWDHAAHDEKFDALYHIANLDKASLIRWMRGHPDVELGAKTYDSLRSIASELNIPKYSRLDKALLIQEITEARKKRNGEVKSR